MLTPPRKPNHFNFCIFMSTKVFPESSTSLAQNSDLIPPSALVTISPLPSTMLRWHSRGCLGPSVTLQGGMPWCHGCGSTPDEIESGVREASSIPKIPASPNRSGLNLSWPCSDLYHRSVLDRAGQDVGSHLVEVLDNRQPVGDAVLESEIEESNDLHDVRPQDKSKSIQIRTAPYPDLAQPNKQIRVLQLSHSVGDMPIHGKLKIVTLDTMSQADQYEAVPYTWADGNGDKSECKKIYLGDHWDILRITANCHSVLQKLRNLWGLNGLWIDSICIYLHRSSIKGIRNQQPFIQHSVIFHLT